MFLFSKFQLGYEVKSATLLKRMSDLQKLQVGSCLFCTCLDVINALMTETNEVGFVI